MTDTPSLDVKKTLPLSLPTAWAYWRAHRTLWIMLGASMLVHAFAFLGTPSFLRNFVAPKVVGYQAVLLDVPPVSFGEQAVPVATPVVTKPRVRKPAAIAPVATPPKSEANFIAPENAIAVAPVVASDAESPRAADIDGLVPYPERIATNNFPVKGTDTNLESNAEPMPKRRSAPTDEMSATGIVSQNGSGTEHKPESKPPTPAEAVQAPLIDFPDKLSIDYRITSSITDGNASFNWRRNGKQYELESTIKATGFLADMFVGAFKQVSRGEITPSGLRPVFFSMRRGDGELDVADFQYDTNELKFTLRNGEKRVAPLPPRLQDMQSFLFQLAHDTAALQGNAGTINVEVTNARKIYRYQFRNLGEEIVETRAGSVTALHLKSEATSPEDTYEVWLAPAHHYLPVKLKFQIGRFPIEQVATNMGPK